MTKLIFSIDDDADKQLMLALGRRLNLVVQEVDYEETAEDTFWEIIDAIDPNDLATIEVATVKLAAQTEENIKAFAELLAAKLFALDKAVYAKRLYELSANRSYFSPDHFLDLRAFVVAQGRAFYESVLNQEKTTQEIGTCEALMSLPAKAWKLKTGKAFDYLPSKSYFTYSNPEGWEQTLLDQLLAK